MIKYSAYLKSFSFVAIIAALITFTPLKSQAATEHMVWKNANSLPGSVMGYITATHNGKIYAIGGSDWDNNMLDTINIGTVADNGDITWTISSHHLPGGIALGSTLVDGNTIYVIGGSLADTTSDAVYIGTFTNDGDITWTTSAHTLPEAFAGGAVAIDNDHVYYAGGYTLEGHAQANGFIGTISDGDITWTTDSTSLPFTVVMSMFPIFESVADGNKIFIITPDQEEQILLVYTGTLENGEISWHQSSDRFPDNRILMSPTILNHDIYMIGGLGQGMAGLDTAYVGTVNGNDVTWTLDSATLPAGVFWAASVSFGDSIYILGSLSSYEDPHYQEQLIRGSLEAVESSESSQSERHVKSNTFKKDTRCLGITPPAVARSTFNPLTNILSWIAYSGDTVEIKFGWGNTELPFTVKVPNTGHIQTGVGTVMGWFGGFWKMRTINGCKIGPWSQIYHL